MTGSAPSKTSTAKRSWSPCNNLDGDGDDSGGTNKSPRFRVSSITSDIDGVATGGDNGVAHPQEDGSNNNRVYYYTDDDVLCVDKSQSRNPSITGHPGNQRYYVILGNYYSQYQQMVQKEEKKAILQQALDDIQSNGARFMSKPKESTSSGTNNNDIRPTWVELKASKVHQKLRDALGKYKAKLVACRSNQPERDHPHRKRKSTTNLYYQLEYNNELHPQNE
jgi:hypothetical protein